MNTFVIPEEIIRPLKRSTSKAFLIFFQFVLFLVLFFPEAQRVYPTIIASNIAIMIPTLFYMYKKIAGL